MQKVEIELSEEKLIQEGYTLNDAFSVLDKAFEEEKLIIENKKNNSRIYAGTGLNSDFSAIGIVCLALRKEPWFTDCVIKWLYHNTDGGRVVIDDFKRDWSI